MLSRRCWPLSLAVIGVVLLFSITMASLTQTAYAGHVPGHYWGYDNMTSTNPVGGGSGAKCWYNFGAGTACSGWNNWDRSRVDYNSGNATIQFGFKHCTGCYILGDNATYTKWWTIVRTDYNANRGFGEAINAYNFGICRYNNDPSFNLYAYSYCDVLIFP